MIPEITIRAKRKAREEDLKNSSNLYLVFEDNSWHLVSYFCEIHLNNHVPKKYMMSKVISNICVGGGYLLDEIWLTECPDIWQNP